MDYVILDRYWDGDEDRQVTGLQIIEDVNVETCYSYIIQKRNTLGFCNATETTLNKQVGNWIT